jgi:hypothetical protein
MQNEIEYYKNLAQMQLKTQRKSMHEKYVDALRLEIDGLKDIASISPQAISEKIMRRVSRIEKALAKLEPAD